MLAEVAAEGRLTLDPQLTVKRAVRLPPAPLRPHTASKSVENHINMLYARLGVNSGDRTVTPRVQAARIYLDETSV